MGHTKDGSDAQSDAFTRHPSPPSLLPSDPHRQARRQGWLQGGGKGWRQWMCCTRLVVNPHPWISAHTRRSCCSWIIREQGERSTGGTGQKYGKRGRGLLKGMK